MIFRSPSVWRVWIEISMLCLVAAMLVSPSVWRVWIEIGQQQSLTGSKLSPSVWRVWIEIYTATYINPRRRSHPPCGGCGLKFSGRLFALLEYVSPSVWRVWIEICYHFKVLRSFYGHSPCGGCGLKYLSDVYPDRSLDHSLYGKRG